MAARTFPSALTLSALVSLLLIAVLTGQIGRRITDEQYPQRREESLLRTAERRILSEEFYDPRTVELKIPSNFELPTVVTDDHAAVHTGHAQPVAANDGWRFWNAGRTFTICGRKTGPLPGMIEPGPEPDTEAQMEQAFRQYVSNFAEKANVKPVQGTLLLNNQWYGQTGNMMRELFHGIDIARHHDLIPVIYPQEDGKSFPIERDLMIIFPFLDLDEIRRIFRLKILGDPGLDLDLQAYEGVKPADLLNFGGGRIMGLRGNKFPKSEINSVRSNRRRIIQQMFELMEARADFNEETQAMCDSIQEASIKEDTKYTVIHSRSFGKEGR